ncbi:MAG: Ig-like domain-containing protein [Planctomycetales bacterium]
MNGIPRVLTILAPLLVLIAGCGRAEDLERARRDLERARREAQAADSGAEREEVVARDAAGQSDIRITHVQSPDGKTERLEIAGFSDRWLEQLPATGDASDWEKNIAVRVVGDGLDDPPAMLGEWRVEERRLVFIPRFPLTSGTNYAVTVRGLTAAEAGATHRFSTPPRDAAPAAVVSAVYPSRDVLPENQLKFYLHFSAPMSRGQAYEHIRLLKTAGEQSGEPSEEVEDPFLRLGEELWDPSGTRFTLFIDPGRIKRGLKPREEIGPVLEAGGSYVLVVEAGWEDAEGNPVAEKFEKRFRVGPPDEKQPAFDRWQLDVPAAGSKDALAITFDEPLDRAMLERVLVVNGPDGKRLAGEVAIEAEETRWRFVPKEAWQAGEHTLAVDAALEDLAGNSLGRPFEVDVFDKIDRSLEQRIMERKFQIP